MYGTCAAGAPLFGERANFVSNRKLCDFFLVGRSSLCIVSVFVRICHTNGQMRIGLALFLKCFFTRISWEPVESEG